MEDFQLYGKSPYHKASKMSLGNAWYLLQVLISTKSNTFKDFSKQNPTVFDSKHEMGKGLYGAYLNTNQYDLFRTRYFLNVREMVYPAKINTTLDDGNYSIIASDDFNYPKCEKIESELYLCEKLTKNEAEVIASSNKVLKIEPYTNITLMMRYTGGFLQLYANFLAYEPNSPLLRTPRFLTLMGLDGKDEIVSVLDGGVSMGHTFFHDSKQTLEYNKTNLEHRKVVRYDTFIENPTYNEGNYMHGTSVSGIIAGTPEDNLAANKLYEGLASGAKLYITEISDDKLIKEEHLIKQKDVMKEVGSHISSNSWVQAPNSIMMKNIDKLAYENKDILYLFPVNNEKGSSISSPADSKNSLTVGFTTKNSNPYTEFYIIQPFIYDSSNTAHEVIQLSVKSSVYQTTSPLKNYGGLKISLEDAEGVAFLSTTCKVPNVKASLVITSVNDTCEETEGVPILMVTPESFEYLKTQTILSIFFNYGENNILKSEYSSFGPTQFHIKKPELVVPGENIGTAKTQETYNGDTSFNTLGVFNGASVAVPQVAGEAAIVRQYFVKGFYPTLEANTADSINPSSALIRAALINGALPAYQNVLDKGMGFGLPILGLGLGFMNIAGARFIDNVKVKSHSTYAYKIKLTNPGLLSVTMSYVDYYSANDYYTLTCDLDLVVVNDVTGKVYTGNMLNNNMAEEFQTNERVYINNAEAGAYTIYVYSNIFDDSKVDIQFSLSIIGNFGMKDFDSNKAHLDPVDTNNLKCPSDCSGNGECINGRCKCKDGFGGHLCNYKYLPNNKIDEPIVSTLPGDYPEYIHVNYPKGSKYKIAIQYGHKNVDKNDLIKVGVSYNEAKVSDATQTFIVKSGEGVIKTDFITPPEGSTEMFVHFYPIKGLGYIPYINVEIYPLMTPMITPFSSPFSTPFSSPFVTPFNTPSMSQIYTPQKIDDTPHSNGDSILENSVEKDSLNVGAITGIVVAAVIVIVLIIVAVLLYIRYKDDDTDNDDDAVDVFPEAKEASVVDDETQNNFLQTFVMTTTNENSSNTSEDLSDLFDDSDENVAEFVF